ncbi:MAG TPA: TetR/AcrR family transcriptional regulator [Chitinophagaceae bacterium]|nr:TetR/AcrR family transcriptional regulator [Chitinophagaceae bacterium]
MSKAEKTRAFIVEKTAPIFNTKGYAGTSLTDMTDATGLTKGSIYGNFENKDEVALAAFDFNLRQVRSIIGAEMDKRSTVKEKLLVYVDVYENFMHYPFPVGGCPILNTAVEADDTHPGLKKKAADAIISWKNSVIKLVEEGQRKGEFSPGLEAEQVALTIIAMIEGGVMISKLTGKQAYRKAVMQSVSDYVKGLV